MGFVEGDWREKNAKLRLKCIHSRSILVYVGDLAPLFGQMRRALRAGGLFAFSCEALDDGRDHAILPSNRFAHAIDYVTRTAQAAGFDVVAAQRAVLRQDHGRDIAGHLVVARAA